METIDLIKIVIADALVFGFILWLVRYNFKKKKKRLEDFSDDELEIWTAVFEKMAGYIKKNNDDPEAVPNRLDDCLLHLLTNYNIKKNE